MAGLTSTGFVPLTYKEIKARIESKLETLNAGFDFSPESPDGQLIGIMAFELGECWSQLSTVYQSHNPTQATGPALRNIGLITGMPYGSASRSRATIDLTGTTGVTVPRNSAVSDAAGNIFTTSFDTVLPSSVEVTSSVAGPIPVPAGTINTIVTTAVVGWTGVAQPNDGLDGLEPESETAYRNKRQKTVMRNYSSVASVIQARLVEKGIEQATVYNNNTLGVAPDGTPAQHIHVTVNAVAGVTDEEVARVILEGMGVGTPTFGGTSVVIADAQGFPQTINFDKSLPIETFIDLDVTFLDADVAGAVENIRAALVEEINSYLSGEDVIHSRLYGVITPFAKAQINSLQIGRSLVGLAPTNMEIFTGEYAIISTGNINITQS
jgi:uncharacterized phage protein gp47/JayE